MLSSLDENNVKVVWHKKFFDACKSRLSDNEYLIMIKELNRVVQDTDKEFVVAGFIPGSDWTETVWEPVYTNACGEDDEHSAQFFGLLVCQVLIDRDEKWYFLKQSDFAKSMIYFKEKERNNINMLTEKFGE